MIIKSDPLTSAYVSMNAVFPLFELRNDGFPYRFYHSRSANR